MKLKNKILTLIAGTLTTFALTSCNDFLDRDPLGQFTEDDAPNALIGGKMYNVYYLMRSYNITAGIPAFMIHMVRSEDSEKGSDAGDGADQADMWDDFQYTASNGTLSAYWGQNYKIIYQCNEILDDLENSGNKDDLENIRTKGEALFFRAYCYFNLVRAWGEVPFGNLQSERGIRRQRAQNHCGQDIRANRQRPRRSREMPAADVDFRVYRTYHMGSRAFAARPYLYDAQRLE